VDYIKIGLIGLIAVISYYLLLQWSQIPTFEPNQDDNNNPIKTESILIDKRIDDSKDSLTALDEVPLSPLSRPPSGEATYETSRVFYIENDVVSFEVDSITGQFSKASFKEIKVEKNSLDNFSLLGSRQIESEGGCPIRLGAVQNGNSCFGKYFASSGYFSPSSGYLNPKFNNIEEQSMGDSGKVFILSGENEGLYFTKRIFIRPGQYSIEVQDSVAVVGGGEPISVIPYTRILRDGYRRPGRFLDFDSYTYLGPVFSTDDDAFQKLDFTDLTEESFETVSSGGWFALVQRYFVSAWVPEAGKTHKYQARKLSSGAFSIAVTGQNRVLSDGNTSVYKNTLFVGPKIAEPLNSLHPDLGLVVDYGFLWWLSEPIHKLMSWGFALFGNWGIAILFATIILKAVLWPLSAAGYRSAAKMRAVAPKMSELQQKYSNDRQKLGQEMMAFYKKEGVSPLGGCLPMLLQMPFFLAFYWVLLDMVELRHAPFLFWIQDLSSYDPFFVLPILNAGLMYYSQKMMPVTPSNDPTQQQMQSAMKFMPIMIAVMFCIFPAGFVLYFTVQSLITVIQQALSFRKEGISLKSV
tara:strand:- start:15705 stop:17441 length:1737 start_codon:yes stop_codon:yes gene_type:complete